MRIVGVADLVVPVKRLVELYVCPVCEMAQIQGSAKDRYRSAQRCCAPKECPRCGAGIPNRTHHVGGLCRKCSQAEQERRDFEKWQQAPEIDVATLDDYQIVAGNDWYPDLEEFLFDCEDNLLDPASRCPYVGLWQTASVPNLSEACADDLPDEGAEHYEQDFDELEAYLKAEYERRRIGAYFHSNKRPVLPTPEGEETA